MSHDRLATTTSPKTRLGFLLDDSAPNGRLPDRGRVVSHGQQQSATRALSADGNIGSTHANAGNSNSTLSPSISGIPPPPRSVGSLDWNPGRQHSNDSLSSSGSIDIYGAAHRDDSSQSQSESGSASGTSPRIRVLPAPSLLPAAHLLQSSVYGGVLNAYSAPPVHQPQQRQQQQSHQHQHAPHQSHSHQHNIQHPLVPQPPVPQLPTPQTQAFPPLAQATLIPPRIVPAPLISAGSVTTPMNMTTPNISISNTTPTRTNNHNHRNHATAGSTTAASRTEQQLRERHDQRKMKNRISAAASRDRKKRSFATLQISLQEAENRCQESQKAIESLKSQLEAARGESNIRIPPDLRHMVGGAEYVSQQQIIDLLRRFSNQLT